MANRLIRLSFQILLVGLAAGSVNLARADYLVTVGYSGTGTPQGSTSQIPFTGSFTYNTGQGGALSGGWWVFSFSSPTGKQVIVYQLQNQPKQTGAGATALPFAIWTTGSTFKLVATDPQSPKTTVSITLPTYIPLPPGSLPACTNSSGVEYFQTSVLTPSNSLFTLSVNGSVTFSGTITAITSCTSTPLPTPPPHASPYYYVIYQEPQSACCLTRIFGHGCFRRRCR